jgi:hypothetical protein
MLSKEQLLEAMLYNSRAFSKGRVDVSVLPEQYINASPSEIVAWTYIFQVEKGLTPDGKLDLETFDLIRTDETTVTVKIPTRIHKNGE